MVTSRYPWNILMEIISFFQGLLNMKWSGGEELEILVQDPKITYLRNCPNNFNPEKTFTKLLVM